MRHALAQRCEFRRLAGELQLRRTLLDERLLAFIPGQPADTVAQIGERAFKRAQLRLDRRGVERRERNRLVGENRAAFRGDFGETARDKDALADLVALINIDDPGTDRRDEQRMAGKDAEI